jgi:hypothetical protein
MTEQQQHLEFAIKQQNVLIEEINRLNASLNLKKEQATKLQGVIEYLNGIGVSIEENPSESEISSEQEEEGGDK